MLRRPPVPSRPEALRQARKLIVGSPGASEHPRNIRSIGMRGMAALRARFATRTRARHAAQERQRAHAPAAARLPAHHMPEARTGRWPRACTHVRAYLGPGVVLHAARRALPGVALCLVCAGGRAAATPCSRPSPVLRRHACRGSRSRRPALRKRRAKKGTDNEPRSESRTQGCVASTDRRLNQRRPLPAAACSHACALLLRAASALLHSALCTSSSGDSNR
ncbi:hypothetical protein FA09DRAFT_232022 [Tilletiopsis washingtonensis]|uniref:Uncharacterized protein n=1 Tax=Tilletiopsis washingtonensis TaxID=58919 RepID=A0A316ZGQ1_9BASI|nr:hypothetical protein FA09DRAFT_232022 [Tilletiopsis washingtonensis]PWN99463.1 hypothetical protein FA09DRAFT_232022 [Tilletiopsis washingtonensis]